MGVKSLGKYLNEYPEAEFRVKEITRKLIHLEEKLSESMKVYL